MCPPVAAARGRPSPAPAVTEQRWTEQLDRAAKLGLAHSPKGPRRAPGSNPNLTWHAPVLPPLRPPASCPGGPGRGEPWHPTTETLFAMRPAQTRPQTPTLWGRVGTSAEGLLLPPDVAQDTGASPGSPQSPDPPRARIPPETRYPWSLDPPRARIPPEPGSPRSPDPPRARIPPETRYPRSPDPPRARIPPEPGSPQRPDTPIDQIPPEPGSPQRDAPAPAPPP
ncbi:proline-rich proteoglycan 2-like [Dasypus novemcinctus]|uniref:proline-rich proteoglycan 2-like n=1 Tax=Dasypus novemcinctus TaxID=9361 RepID=UPI00265DAFD0|nr:proline-rich proteoglycan 2-like [Dasypus novemcinctus]